MTFTSPLPSVSVPAVPLTPYVLERCGGLADKAAFVDGVTGRTMTYGEFEVAVRRQGGGWLESGLAQGEVVAVMAPNCPDYGVVFHAVALAGGVVTTVNPTYTPGEVHHQLVDAGATRLVTVPMFLPSTVTAEFSRAIRLPSISRPTRCRRVLSDWRRSNASRPMKSPLSNFTAQFKPAESGSICSLSSCP